MKPSRAWTFEDLSPTTQPDTRQLILAGLTEHWGVLDLSLNPDLDDLLTSYEHGRTVVATTDAAVIGTGTLVPRSPTTAEIVRMSVAPSHRRSGLGQAIVDELLDTARSWGCDQVILETNTDWVGVVMFYLSCGFTITHTEDGEFGEDSWFSYELQEASPATSPSQPQ